ncbi:hypothetical protein AB0M46_51160, partial [Dactylosporangium sp. NPDC051485]|uniref:hypothetical protein n=1 Tax=Dactylosporangium sp. NPDC051485 TaxID=3154846 RepID=UPI003426CEAC
DEQLAAFDRDLAAAGADGDPAAALAASRRADAKAARRLEEELPAEAARLAEERAAYERDRAAAQGAFLDLSRDRAVLHAERAPLLAELDALGGDPRLTVLAEQDRLDPVGEHRLLVDLLTEAVIAADRQRIQLAVADAEDDRALQALAAARGLLPAALDLARAADALAAQRIPATTGWHFLADSVPPEAWPAAIAHAPHLVGGLLVDDPALLDRARSVLEAGRLFPTSAIQVATTAALREVVSRPVDGFVPAPAVATSDALRFVLAPAVATAAALGEVVSGPVDGFVLAPAVAMYDRTAAAGEVERRDAGRAERNRRVQELLDTRDGDMRLKGRLLDLAERCPPGHREHLDAEHERLTTALAAAEQRLAELHATREALDGRAATLDRDRRDLAEQRRRQAGRIAALAGLEQRAPGAERLRHDLAELPGRRADLQEQLAEAETQERLAAAATSRHGTEADRDAQRLREYRARCEELRRIASAWSGSTSAKLHRARPGEAAPTGPLPSLAEATTAYQAANDAYIRQTSASALEATIAEIERSLAALEREIQRFDPAERSSATALLDGTSLVDAAAVQREIDESERAFLDAQRDATLAGAALTAARRHLDACPLVGLDLDEVGAVRDAERLAQQAEERLGAVREAERAARDRVVARGQAREAALRRADDLRELVTDLTEDIGSLDVGGSAFAGDVDEARESTRGARRALQAADRALVGARAKLGGEAHRIDRWAAEERFAAVSPEVRGRFRGEVSTVDARLVEQLQLYRHGLAGELDAVEKDKHLVVTALCAEVREGLKTLQRAQHHAQLPPGLADHLRNRRFLDVGPRASVDTSDATVRSRVERLVDKLVAGGDAIPDGLALAWEAIAVVVGRGNFVARVLKPSTEITDDRQPVELMSKWSGGEKVTISLLLFCMLARLRAANRGGDVPGLGVLPMDNPLGTANYVAFLDLQRRVAAANGIQLVFLSGLGDMRAVGRFPNVVRMRNTHNQGRNYARVMERELNEEQILEGITAARLTFPAQGTLL